MLIGMGDLGSQTTDDRDSKRASLKSEIKAPELLFLMEAHSGLSARIVEEAGFRGIWASGLTISASLGLRDCNEASWTQVLEVLECMADSSSLPILVDGDTGYGNFNNVRRLVRKLCQRHIAGVCLEDKLFPKTNSFIGERQPLADVDEFCGKIKAGKDSQTSEDFVIVARVEALISGLGIDEALRRAEAYHAAGADAILIHSKMPKADEILEFARHWAKRAPLVIVPTTYFATSTDLFRDAGIAAVIWANHLMRSSIIAMRRTASAIHEQQSPKSIEPHIASVRDIFRLTDIEELEQAEVRYLPPRRMARAIVIGGFEAGPTGDGPTQPQSESSMSRVLNALAENAICNVAIISASLTNAERVLPGVTLVRSVENVWAGEAWLRAVELEKEHTETIITTCRAPLDGDMLRDLLAIPGEIVLAANVPSRMMRSGGRARSDLEHNDVQAELPFPEGSIELAKLSGRGVDWLRCELERLRNEAPVEWLDLATVFSRLAQRHPVNVRYRAATAPAAGISAHENAVNSCDGGGHEC